MEVLHCKKCGKLFNYIGGRGKICMACREALEDKFIEVRDYIRANKYATINEISAENDVSVQQIRQWVREERLMFTAESPMGIDCEGCGNTIKTGRFCDKCKSTLKSEINSMYKKDKPEDVKKKDAREKARMRFLDSDGK